VPVDDPRVTTDGLSGAVDASALLDLMTRRRSIRRLRGGPVSGAALDRIAAAVELSPAAFDVPAWRVVVLRERRAEFWAMVDDAIDARLDGDRRQRYHERIDAIRASVAVALLYEDLEATRRLQVDWNIAAADATTFVDQGLGMVQMAIWLAAVGEGLASSIHHFEWLIEEAAATVTGIDRQRYRLRASMPIGYADETPRPPVPRGAPTWVVDDAGPGLDYTI
jgi:uncharacterized protein